MESRYIEGIGVSEHNQSLTKHSRARMQFSEATERSGLTVENSSISVKRRRSETVSEGSRAWLES